MKSIRISFILTTLLLPWITTVTAAGKPTVKIVMVAGEGNVEGYASVNHLKEIIHHAVDHLKDKGHNPYGHLIKSANPLEWSVRDDVYVTYEHYQKSSTDILLSTPLTVNSTFAAHGTSYFGPEVQIGHVMGDAYDDLVVIVKAGWHDRTLAKDFCPQQCFQWYRWLNTLERTISEMHHITHNSHYKHPEIDYVGMIWWHGYSDYMNREYYKQYEENLRHFLREVRSTVRQPDLPIVVASMGANGISRATPLEIEFREMQQKVCDETKAMTVCVDTAKYAEQIMPLIGNSPRNETQYYLGRADTMLEISQDLALALVDLKEAQILRRKQESSWLWRWGSHNKKKKNKLKDNAIENLASAEFEDEEEAQANMTVMAISIMAIGMALLAMFYLQKKKKKKGLPLIKFFRLSENDDDDNNGNDKSIEDLVVSEQEMQSRAQKFGVNPQY